MKKPSALLFVAIVMLGIMVGFTTYTAKATNPGSVTILKPTGSEEVLFYEKVTVKFSVTTNPGWIYTGAWIIISGVKVDTTSSGQGTPFEKSYYPEAYSGEHTVSVKAFFINFFLEEEYVYGYGDFTVNPCANMTDIEDLRIDEL